MVRVLAYKLHFKSWNNKGAWMKAVLNLNDSPDYIGTVLTHMFDSEKEKPEKWYIAGYMPTE